VEDAMTAYTRMTRKGQVTIPIAVRKELGLREGDQFIVRTEGSRVILDNASAALRSTAGSLAKYALPTPPTPDEEQEAVEMVL
jgi:AbrB family looped-hinge helix DNA binding protein